MIMPKRTETVNLTEEDLRQAIDFWLVGRYSGTPSDWTVVLNHEVLTEGFGAMERDTTHYSAVAVRDIK